MLTDPAVDSLVSRIAHLNQHYEVGLTVDVRSVAISDDDVALDLVLVQDGDVDSRWTVRVREPLESRISVGLHLYLEVLDNHPLLIEASQRHADLYFRGPASEPSAVLGDLLLAHRRVLKDWRPLDPYMNDALWSMELLGFPSGLLGRGPVALMEAYAEVLNQHGVLANLDIRDRFKVWRDDIGQWRERDWSPVLLILERPTSNSRRLASPDLASFVVGRSISAERLDLASA